MKRWTMRCGVCGKVFDREQTLSPLTDLLPEHTREDLEGVPCLGSGGVPQDVTETDAR